MKTSSQLVFVELDEKTSLHPALFFFFWSCSKASKEALLAGFISSFIPSNFSKLTSKQLNGPENVLDQSVFDI